MRILYNLAFIIFGVVYLPYLIVTRRYRYGIADRFGILSERFKRICSGRRIIWIHGVSMGEMKTAGILAPLLRKAFPGHTLLFSSVTNTGNKTARAIAAGNEEVFYPPFDISFAADRVVRAIRPELFLCMETELWPNLISSLYGSGARVVLINGRISDRSYIGYKKVKFAVSGILRKFSLMLMQSEQDAVRAMALGASRVTVHVTGNLKFDLLSLAADEGRKEIRDKLGMAGNDTLLAAGSTHRGEDEALVECYSGLMKEYRNLRLLVAPRHVERTAELERLIVRLGFKPVRFSRLDTDRRAASRPHPWQAEQVLILDTAGDLKTVYSASDIVFVGGSLVKKGGQNPIEPASLAKPVIFGKFTFNFQDVVKAFLDNDAAIRVEDKDELRSAIRFLMDNPEERKRIGLNAKDTVTRNSGSGQRSLDMIKALL